jgi:DNA topoisomerase-2
MAGLAEIGGEYYGIFLLRDKLLNVRDASIDQIMNNGEINNIKKILRLQHGVEYDNTSKLRYDHIMLMTDQVCFTTSPTLIMLSLMSTNI